MFIEAFGVLSGLTGIHSWMTAFSTKKEMEQHFTKLNSGIYVLSEEHNMLASRFDSYETNQSTIHATLERIEDKMHQYIGLSELGLLQQDKVKEFEEILSKYVVRNTVPLHSFQDSILKNEHDIYQEQSPIIWNSGVNKEPKAGIIETSFLKDYFGANLNHKSIREVNRREKNTSTEPKTRKHESKINYIKNEITKNPPPFYISNKKIRNAESYAKENIHSGVSSDNIEKNLVEKRGISVSDAKEMIKQNQK